MGRHWALSTLATLANWIATRQETTEGLGCMLPDPRFDDLEWENSEVMGIWGSFKRVVDQFATCMVEN